MRLLSYTGLVGGADELVGRTSLVVGCTDLLGSRSLKRLAGLLNWTSLVLVGGTILDDVVLAS